VQLTPAALGDVLWRGGAGKPGSKGGWGFHCKFPRCFDGARRTAMPNERTADAELHIHWTQAHWTAYVAWLEATKAEEEAKAQKAKERAEKVPKKAP
jgi:hypothetical protein